jgi:hypothetical protein
MDVAVLVEWQGVWRSLEGDLALVQDDDAIDDRSQRAEFVLDEKYRAAVGAEVVEHAGEGDRVGVVDGGGGFVHDQ